MSRRRPRLLLHPVHLAAPDLVQVHYIPAWVGGWLYWRACGPQFHRKSDLRDHVSPAMTERARERAREMAREEPHRCPFAGCERDFRERRHMWSQEGFVCITPREGKTRSWLRCKEGADCCGGEGEEGEERRQGEGTCWPCDRRGCFECVSYDARI